MIAGLEAVAGYDPAARIEVRLDSKLVVEQLSDHAGRSGTTPEMKALVEQARRALPAHGQVTFNWVPRTSNVHADRLANEVLDAAASGRALGFPDADARSGRRCGLGRCSRLDRVRPTRPVRSTRAPDPEVG